MDYTEEARYIENVDICNIGTQFNSDIKCFLTYCQMQQNACKRFKQHEAGSSIGATIERVQGHILRVAIINYMMWNDRNSDISDYLDNYTEVSNLELVAQLHADLYET